MEGPKSRSRNLTYQNNTNFIDATSLPLKLLTWRDSSDFYSFHVYVYNTCTLEHDDKIRKIIVPARKDDRVHSDVNSDEGE